MLSLFDFFVLLPGRYQIRVHGGLKSKPILVGVALECNLFLRDPIHLTNSD